jgi:hypothetical protein
MSPEEEAIYQRFLEKHFGVGYRPSTVGTDEELIIQGILGVVENHFARMKYPLGLALDFALLAQQLALHDNQAKRFRKGLSKRQLFARYKLVTSRGKREANTLTLQFGEAEVGIRKLEESVGELFVELGRPGYPSAYVYNTGQWKKFQDSLLIDCFRLSEAGRYELCKRLINFGAEKLTEGSFTGREELRVRLFDDILMHYPRTAPDENAGMAFQGIAAGFIKADRPHLFLIVDKVRTGSARQARIGDIDGYYGLDLELSVEVKDHGLTAGNVEKEVGEFLAKIRAKRIQGMVIARSADPEAKTVIASHGAVCLTDEELRATVSAWDWRKQDQAVSGLLHYLAHVEQNPGAVNRLLAFIAERDPGHDALAFYKPVQQPSGSE